MPLAVFLAYILAINLCTLLLMGIDKSRARSGGWRVSESSFLLMSIIGGSAGVALGVKIFRHKTRHAKFTVAVPVILIMQLIVLGWLWKTDIIPF